MHPAVGYRELAPPRELRDLVACVWVRVSGADDEVRIVPDGCSDVIWQQGVGTKVVGPDTTAKLVVLAQGDVMIGMRFLPAAGGGGLRMPLDELRDQRVDAAEIDPAFDLPAELAPADVAARFVAAAADRQGDPLVAAAIARLGNQEVAAVARDLWISERQLRRRFHAAVGYGPKTLARILRFRRFVAAIDRGHRDLSTLAFDAGYADQAHLTRETTRLAGMPPAALISARTPPRQV